MSIEERQKKMVCLVWERKVGKKRRENEPSIETLGDSSQLSSRSLDVTGFANKNSNCKLEK